VSDPVDPAELRTGAEWVLKGDREARIRIVGRAYDGLLMFERIAGAPPEHLNKPVPVFEQSLRAAFDPVAASGEVLDDWSRVRDTLRRLAERVGVPFDKLDDAGVGAFERGGHLGAFVPLPVLQRLLDGGDR